MDLTLLPLRCSGGEWWGMVVNGGVNGGVNSGVNGGGEWWCEW